MFELAHPWALLLLPLPLLMWLLPAYRESRDSVRVPFFDKLVELSEQRPDAGATILQRDGAQHFLVVFMWLCLVLAAAQPQWVGAPVEQQKSGRDLMIAVDLSGSMETRDFVLPDGTTVDRLEAVKQVLAELAAQRESDRLGLIVAVRRICKLLLPMIMRYGHSCWQTPKLGWRGRARCSATP
jgi:Ca-activated chloride channel family protein